MSHSLAIAFIILLALAGGVGAVTVGDGPGGVGTTDGGSQLELWVKADALELADGTAVSTWSDASGNGRNLTQGSPSLRPTFVANALGGQPVVRFVEDNFGALTLPSTNNEFTIVAVVKPTITGAYHNIIDGQGGVRPMLWIDGLGNYEFNFTTGAVTPASGNYDVMFAVKRNVGPQYSQLYLNSPSVTASGPNAFTVSANQSYTFFNRSGGQTFSGDVAEFIVYGVALTESEINKVGYYLQEKYSLATAFPSPFPVLTGYQENPVTYGVGSEIPQNAPTISGGTPTSFSISPALPEELLLNPSTGVISGTPTVIASRANYTVVAAFTNQPDSSTQLSIEVTAPSLTGYSREPAIFTRGRAANPILPQLAGGPASSFSVSPPLPAGLNLDPQTGIITGTPTASVASAVYNVTATFSGYPDSIHTLTLEVIETSSTLAISEFMAINGSTIADGDGAFSDWIEVHNYGSVAIDLLGWSLTDNAGTLQKWTFPERIIAPGAYLVVFASGDSHTDVKGYRHTNFKLEGGGEYLALVEPDGLTIASQFSPAYPNQTEDISYGTSDRITFGAYSPATPGAENGFFTAVSTPIAVNPAGRAFSGTLNVTLSAVLSDGAVIRYTLNGTAPTASSPIYSGTLSFSANIRLRARVFQVGLNPGPEASETYMRLGADIESFSSNLPLVFLTTDGAIAPSSSPTLTGTNTIIVDVNPDTGRASAAGSPNYHGRGGLRIRGRSSQSFPQKQFKFETWDGAGNETDARLLGLPSGSDYVLSSPWSDKSLVRNALAYQTWSLLGRKSLGTRFVEVFINDDGDDQFTYEDDYAGIYMLVESIDRERVGISAPQNTTDPANITGGYVNETGNADDQDFSTTGSGRSVAHKYTDPKAANLNGPQKTWIHDYIETFERALYGVGFKDPTSGTGYGSYTDVPSQVDYKIAREWSRNFDGGSSYSHVPRGGKLKMGPLWDYNWAFGNVSYAEGGDLPGYRTDGWNRSFTANVNGWAPWWLRFEQDPDWWQLFIDRWTDLRTALLSDAAVNTRIDEMTAPLAHEAAARNFARWPQLGVFTVISPPGYQSRTTYQSEIDYLKTWLAQRSAWIDSQFPLRPSFSHPPGPIASGSMVTITAGAGATIYYTTDGTDPRAPGGVVAAGALSVTSGGEFLVNSSAIVVARAKVGNTWSAPASAPFVTGAPATAQNLVISEICYHPADPRPAELTSDLTVSDDDFEFIEMHNISGETIDLTGVTFTEGLRFAFPVGATLAAGAYVAVVENMDAFVARYGAGANVAGQYTGNLNNSSDTVVLLAADGAEIARIHYTDAWTPFADGLGYTLTLREPNSVPANYSLASTWALSATLDGSPGAPNGAVVTTDFTLWQQSNFSNADLADVQRSGLLSDPDGDGASNLLEMFLVTLPLDSNSRPAPLVAAIGSDLTFTFTRLRQTIGITATVEESSDFAPWTPIGAPLEVIAQTNSAETVRATVPQNGDSKKFLRLRVTK